MRVPLEEEGREFVKGLGRQFGDERGLVDLIMYMRAMVRWTEKII